jgi:hypothetical protein
LFRSSTSAGADRMRRDQLSGGQMAVPRGAVLLGAHGGERPHALPGRPWLRAQVPAVQRPRLPLRHATLAPCNDTDLYWFFSWTRERVAVERGKEEAARGRADARDFSPRIFMHGEGRFVKCEKTRKGYGKLLKMSFFSFFLKKYGWERYGALRNYFFWTKIISLVPGPSNQTGLSRPTVAEKI